VKDSTSWTEPRVTDKLSAFLKKQASDLKATPSKLPGAPHTIVITASGIRAADVVRSLKAGLPKEGVKNPEVAKLFAKHLKLPAQVYDLKRKKYVGLHHCCLYILTSSAGLTSELERRIG
jgi:protein CMS1